MPHVIVKLWPGKSEQQKTRLAEAITKDVMNILHYGEESVSVAMEEIEPNEWGEKVYRPEIKNNLDRLYKKPGYDENDLWDSRHILPGSGAWRLPTEICVEDGNNAETQTRKEQS